MKTITTLLKYAFHKERHLHIYFLLYTICTGTSSLLSMLFLQLITNIVNSAQLQNKSLFVISICISFAIGIVVTKATSTAMYFKADSRFTYIRTDLQNDISYRIMKFDFEMIEGKEFLEKNERALKSLESSEKGTEMILKTIFQLPGLILSLLSAFFILAAIRFYLPLLFLPHLIVGLWTSKKCAHFREALQHDASKKRIQADYLFDTINDIKCAKELRVFNLRQLFFRKISGRLNDLSSLLRKEERFLLCSHILAASVLFILSSFGCMFIIIIGYRANNISLSQLVVAIYAIINAYSYSEELFEHTEKVIYESGSVRELFKILDMGCMKPDSNFPPLSNQYEYEWEVNNLIYQYPNSSEYALQNISFKLRSNEHLAIVGLNGAGKSTLIKCMTGLYKNYQGQILFRGKDIRDIPIDVLAQHIGVQYQDADVYPFTIKENITSACNNTDIEKLWDSLSAVFPKESLLKFSHNADTVLEKLFDENGVVLSGGEREAFLFSRILYKNPASIILDEPTAKLDAVAEQKIIGLLKNVFADKCIIIISHHLNIAASMNRILLLKDGTLIADGEHQSLLQHCSEYRRLIELQKNYYQNGRS